MKEWMLGIMLVVLVAVNSGCVFSTAGAVGTYAKDSTAPSQLSKTEDIDRKITETKKRKQDLQEYANTHRSQAVIFEQKHNSSRGWIRSDPTAGTSMSHMEHGESADYHNAQAAGTEVEIARINRELSRLEDEKQSALNESMGCFPPETLVSMEDGTSKFFTEISVGDMVMTYDIGHDVQVAKPVVERYEIIANHMYTINDELKTTGGERLLTLKGWETVRNLNVGDFIHINGQMIRINNIQQQRIDMRVVNMQVADTHNFYVQTSDGSRYLVHNSGGGGGGGGK